MMPFLVCNTCGFQTKDLDMKNCPVDDEELSLVDWGVC